MADIVTLTLNPAVDKSCAVDQVVPDRKLRCSPPDFDPGGGGINVARACHKLGEPAAAIWACGGAMGDLLKSLLEQEGITQHPFPIEQMTRENLMVMEESSGQQYRFGEPGASLSDEELQDCLDRIPSLDPPPKYLVASGSLPPGAPTDFYAEVARAAPADCRVVLDTSGEPLQAGLAGPVYLLKPNLRELAHLAGAHVESDHDIQRIADRLRKESGVEVILTSLGSGGAMLSSAEGHEHIRAPTVRIRSKVGAGDSTVAGMIVALNRGKSLHEAALFAVATGAAAVMTPGTELCCREDAERLFEQMQSQLPSA